VKAYSGNMGSGHLNGWVRATFWSGLIASLATILAGFAWLGITGRSAAEGVSLDRIFPSLFAGDPGAMISLGVLALLLTPVAVVVVSLVRFIFDRERAWAGVALLVLAVLALSVVMGLR